MADTVQIEADIAALKQSVSDEIGRAQAAIVAALNKAGVDPAAVAAADAELVALKASVDAAFPAPAPTPAP